MAFHLGERVDYSNFEANIKFLDLSSSVTRDSKILEIGSGKGRLLNHFFSKGYDIRGVEISKRAIDDSRRLFRDLPLQLVSSEKLPFDDEFFDLVVSFDVLEHIHDCDAHLEEVNRVLKKGGVYLLQTPNKLTNIIFEIIMYKNFIKWRRYHRSLHSYWEIKKRFSEKGFKTDFYNVPLINEFFINKIKKVFGETWCKIIKLINIDEFPVFLRTNFFIKSKKI